MKSESLTINDYFRCSELVLISALAYHGFKIEAFEPDPKIPERVFALFKKNDDLDKVLARFWSRELTVEPAAFWSMVREIKSRIRTETNS